MAKFNVVEEELFSKAHKKLSKKYNNIDKDLDNFLNSIEYKSDLGIEIKANVFKARITNSDKNKGKSSGYRLISYLAIIDNKLHLLYIYDKSTLVNVTEQEIDNIILKQIGAII